MIENPVQRLMLTFKVGLSTMLALGMCQAHRLYMNWKRRIGIGSCQ